MSKHSKGPWRTYEWQRSSEHNEPIRIEIVSELDKDICGMRVLGNQGEFRANASLIAAAPEMLDALKVALDSLERARAVLGAEHNMYGASINVLRDAIAKAEGTTK